MIAAVVVLYIFLSTSGLMLLRTSLRSVTLSASTILPLLTNARFMAGAVLYVASFLTWMYLLSKREVSSIYPLVVGLGYIAIVVSSVIFLGESLSTNKIAGIVFVGVGLVFLVK